MPRREVDTAYTTTSSTISTDGNIFSLGDYQRIAAAMSGTVSARENKRMITKLKRTNGEEIFSSPHPYSSYTDMLFDYIADQSSRDRRYGGPIDLIGLFLPAHTNLDGFHCEGVNFKGAMLSGVRMSHITMSRCNFDLANLTRADMRSSCFSDGSFISANLSRALMDDVILDRCDMTNANAEDAQMANLSLEDAILTGSNIMDALAGSFARPIKVFYSGGNNPNLFHMPDDMEINHACSAVNRTAKHVFGEGGFTRIRRDTITPINLVSSPFRGSWLGFSQAFSGLRSAESQFNVYVVGWGENRTPKAMLVRKSSRSPLTKEECLQPIFHPGNHALSSVIPALQRRR